MSGSPAYFSSKLKGYAIYGCPGLNGYFRFHKETLKCFDEKGNRILLHLNARYNGDIHRTLIGFTYNQEKRLFSTSLEEVLQTSDRCGRGERTIIKNIPLLPTQEKILGRIIQLIRETAPALCLSPFPIKSDRYTPELRNMLVGFPDEFREKFLLAVRQDRACSLDQVVISFPLKELGLCPTLGHAYRGFPSPEYVSSGRHRHAHRSHGQ